MPGTPVIANRTPEPAATGVLLTDYIRVSLRDMLTRVDLSSFGAQLSFGRDSYEAQADLPEVELPDSNTFVAAFSDAGPAITVAEVARAVAAGDLALTRPVGAIDHKGAQFLATIPSVRPYMAEIELSADPADLTPGNELYIVAGGGNRYFGVCLGSVYGPAKTGIFIFLMDDGAGNRFLRISGPDNGTGARPGFVDHVYDWNGRTTFKIVWDVGAPHDVVRVYLRPAGAAATNSAMLEFPMAGMATFIAGVAFGTIPVDPAADPVEEILVFLNLDSRAAADTISSSFMRTFNFGRQLVIGGNVGLSSELHTFTSDVVEAATGSQPRDVLVPWAEHFLDPLVPPMAGVTGSLSYGTTDEEWVFSKVASTDNGSLPCFVRREEPALSLGSGLWFLAEFTAADIDHPATVATGMGFIFDDGANQLALMLVDTFALTVLGVYQGGDKRLPASYSFGADLDWTTNIVVKVWLDAASGELQVFLDGSATPYLTFNTAGLPASVAAGTVSVGHADFYPGHNIFGLFELDRFSYGMGAIVYSPRSGNLPPAAASPWVEVSTGAGVAALVGDDCVVTDPDFAPSAGPPAGNIYELRSLVGVIDSLSGVTVELRMAVIDWTDDLGSPNPLNVSVWVGALIDDGGASTSIRFVRTVTEDFVYLDTNNPVLALADVIAQTTAGQKISAPVNFTSHHVYRLERRPNQYVRLYIDDAAEPAIDVAWGDLAHPAAVLGGAAIAWGSFDTHQATTTSWGDLVYMTSNGYDVAMLPLLSEEEYSYVFDSAAEIVLETDGM